MYDHIPASLYRNILVETNGKKYRLRISEGEVSESKPMYTSKQIGEADCTAKRAKQQRQQKKLITHLSLSAGMFTTDCFLGHNLPPPHPATA
jgi:hypothetical protein